MWYLKRLDEKGEIEQLITCEINPPRFNNAYKMISKEEYNCLMNNFLRKQKDMNLPPDPEILGTVI